MTVSTATKPKFLQISDELHEMINKRSFVPGTQMFSRQEICERYGISDMTAFKVHAELQNRKLVISIPGKGVFVRRDLPQDIMHQEDTIANSLKRIFIHRTKRSTARHRISIRKAMAQKAKSLGIDISYEESGMAQSDIITKAMQFELAPDEGIIFLGGSQEVQAAYYRILSDSSYLTAVIDTIIPGSICILTDNHHGMFSLVNHAIDVGCERLIYAGRFGTIQNQINENERREAFERISSELNLDATVINSGCYEELTSAIKSSDASTAVMFSQDDPALVFKSLVKSGKVPAPELVTGFDGIALREKGFEHLTTYEVDLKGLGETAVESLAEYEPSWKTENFHRVRGKLIVRE